jgi:succinoglycan biosynthesis protein ExoM
MPERSQPAESAVTGSVCTFRRPGVLTALESVARQALADRAGVRIIVIDNDAEPTARDAVAAFAATRTARIDYRHVPGQNISVARNAGVDACTTRWLAFLDDDECAAYDWLPRLLAGRDGASAVFGPCEAIYGERTRAWIRAGDYHANRIADRGRPIDTGYTSNVLIDLDFVRRHGLRFDTALGRTGGEDTMFFHAMYRSGGALRYAADAIVYEDVAPGRTNARWIATRRYRAGQVYAMMFERFDAAVYRRIGITAAAKAAFCVLMGLATAWAPGRAMWWLMRGVFHCGVLSYRLGASVHAEYGAG